MAIQFGLLIEKCVATGRTNRYHKNLSVVLVDDSLLMAFATHTSESGTRLVPAFRDVTPERKVTEVAIWCRLVPSFASYG